MAQATTSNFYNIQQHTNWNSDVRYYYYYYFPQSRELIVSSSQAAFAFMVSVLLNFLQVKYQGNHQSPFETNPKTTFLAAASLLLYCLSYHADLRISQNHQHPESTSNFYTYYCYLVSSSMAFFGSLSLASILSLLVPESLSPVLYSLAIFLMFFRLAGARIKKIWDWLRAVIVRKFLQRQTSTAPGVIARTLVSVQLLPMPEDRIIDQTDLLPV